MKEIYHKRTKSELSSVKVASLIINEKTGVRLSITKGKLVTISNKGYCWYEVHLYQSHWDEFSRI